MLTDSWVTRTPFFLLEGKSCRQLLWSHIVLRLMKQSVLFVDVKLFPDFSFSTAIDCGKDRIFKAEGPKPAPSCANPKGGDGKQPGCFCTEVTIPPTKITAAQT